MITGFHHIALKCDDKEKLEKALELYELLGFTVYNEWETGFMLKNNDAIIEIFINDSVLPIGTIRHFALKCTSVAETMALVHSHGFEIKLPFKEINMGSIHAYIGFIVGGLGEEIELFQEL